MVDIILALPLVKPRWIPTHLTNFSTCGKMFGAVQYALLATSQEPSLLDLSGKVAQEAQQPYLLQDVSKFNNHLRGI